MANTKNRTDRYRAAILGALTLAAACMHVGPDAQPPEAAIPATWRDRAGLKEPEPAPELGGWWRRLEDPVLDELVARATAQGLDVREALARVREARALRGAAHAERFPTL